MILKSSTKVTHNAYFSTEGLLRVFIFDIINADDVNYNKCLEIPICILGSKVKVKYS